mmetsp:Transcript_8447/g.12591  ORF Transcript_8447/g.12591 Transcript_8447/m.12591 type:complete len:546 (+) Transcript_8447:183-1820(+)|eukprot:CAMPEP_0185040502 /NCGR_PEP_ID=MMETSP1103-20130426/38635_1 /TAXON_ID=36769 /ORGANISM="Paraphysomonas bandaiensis, Strain Caron Lab Isolate" /LENGTH=545 /DNA_ID=CAMNT_0027579827 /DNA_START=120 /DNA_END=1757 /DNA_ORIENTATION=-
MSNSTEKNTVSSSMLWILIGSIFMASANSILYKQALNAFSSPTSNYGFFVGQFSILLYIGQAAVVSVFVIWKNPHTLREIYNLPQSVYLYMGGLDSGSSTLGAIAGAYCPGEMQTILNQMVIPLTMIGAFTFLGSQFERYQIYGSVLILIGAAVASSDYLFYPSHHGSHIDPSADADAPDDNQTHSGGIDLPVAISIYLISVVPSALSNIYKERKMKELDMNEVHTSTIVSFWQLWIGFIFLPMLSLPSLGGLSYEQMTSQLSDGYTCFTGVNPHDSNGNCSSAAFYLMAYILVNFFYNILLLAITKRGSAVLLVMSQALSLPLTNIAFTLTPLMGDDAEPLSIMDLVGLVLVCIGFLAYSGFGFAPNFMVAQGPPGQMAYAHFEDHNEVIVSTKVATDPQELADFIVGSILQSMTIADAKDEESGTLALEDDKTSPLRASTAALDVLKQATVIVERHVNAMKRGLETKHMTTPEIMRRYNTVTSSPHTGKQMNEHIVATQVSLIEEKISRSRDNTPMAQRNHDDSSPLLPGRRWVKDKSNTYTS